MLDVIGPSDVLNAQRITRVHPRKLNEVWRSLTYVALFSALARGHTMADEELNAYQLLDVDGEATEQQIRTAYRQRSLKVHPDRVRYRFIVDLALPD